MDNLYEITVDGFTFLLSSATLDVSPVLSNVIRSKKSQDNIFLEGNKIIIDCDPKSFSFVVDVLRGYKPDLTNVYEASLKNKIRRDLQFFKLNNTLYKESDIADMLEETKKDETFETLETIDLGIENRGGGFKNQEDIDALIHDTDNQLKLGNMDVINNVSNNQNIKEIIKNSFPKEQPSPENSDEELPDLDIDLENQQDGGYLVSCSSQASTRYIKIN